MEGNEGRREEMNEKDGWLGLWGGSIYKYDDYFNVMIIKRRKVFLSMKLK